ncbi:hypothetical protein Hanom_Chr07g00594861 [Helianthus anomalus]
MLTESLNLLNREPTNFISLQSSFELFVTARILVHVLHHQQTPLSRMLIRCLQTPLSISWDRSLEFIASI